MKADPILDMFSRLKRMSYHEFETKLGAYGQASFNMGLKYSNENGVTWFEDDIFDVMIDCGVDPDTANKVIDILVSGETK